MINCDSMEEELGANFDLQGRSSRSLVTAGKIDESAEKRMVKEAKTKLETDLRARLNEEKLQQVASNGQKTAAKLDHKAQFNTAKAQADQQIADAQARLAATKPPKPAPGGDPPGGLMEITEAGRSHGDHGGR